MKITRIYLFEVQCDGSCDGAEESPKIRRILREISLHQLTERN